MRVRVLEESSLKEIACGEIDGQPVLPADFPLARFENQSGELKLLRRRSTFGVGPDVVTGWLRIPYVTASMEVESLALWIPPPEPFLSEDIEVMWEEVLRAPWDLPQPVPAQGSLETDASLTLRNSGVRFQALKGFWSIAKRLLGNWPQQESTTWIWKGIDLPGGREDEMLTLRHPRAAAGTRLGNTLTPERSARLISGTNDWKLNSVSSVSLALAKRLEASVNTETVPLISHLVGAAARIAAIARPAAVSSDPPISSWPHVLAALYRLALQALAEAETLAVSKDEVPLCDLWRLYESWVTLSVVRELQSLMGDPGLTQHGSRSDAWAWAAQWALPSGGLLRVASQETIAGHTSGNGAQSGKQLFSVSSVLIPDVLISYMPADKEPIVMVIDAKKRSGSKYERSSVAEAASKYLWGARALDGHDVPGSGLSSVVLVSPIPAEEMLDPTSSRIQSTVWHPRTEVRLPVSDWLKSLGVPDAQ